MSKDYLNYPRKLIQVGQPAVQLSAVEFGPRDAPALLFLHGGAGSLTQWRHQFSHLESRFRLVAFDFRGHGQSQIAPSKYTIAELVQDLEEAVQALDMPEQFFLLAHSFGGALAAEYAAKHPERLKGMVMIATAGELPLTPWVWVPLSMPLPLLKVVRHFLKNQIQAPPVVVKKLVPHLLKWRGWDLFPVIPTPTLVISGELDYLTRPKQMRKLHELLPSSEFETVRWAGHLPQLERPAAVNRLIDRFLDPGQRKSWRG